MKPGEELPFGKEQTMKRHKILYSKRGAPMVRFADSPEKADQIAGNLRRYGYSADVWELDKNGARPAHGWDASMSSF